jgi:hypothetical protein
MIAFVQIVLQSPLLILPDEQLEALTYEGDALADAKQNGVLAGADQVQVSVLPPYRSQRPADASPGVGPGDPDLFNAADPQPVEEHIEIDGKAAIRCDAIAVRIDAPGFEFDRRRDGTAADTIRSLLGIACDAVNGILQRIRVLARATHLRPLEPDSILYRLVFLDDSEAPLEADEEKFRQTWTTSYRIRHVAVTHATWQEAVALGEYETPPWDALLLDAMDLDIDLGPSLVLAATAVETRIAHALDLLAKDKVPDGLWEWIKTRGGDYTKEPSVAEQLDALLKAFGGRSLKDDERLWAAGGHLRAARNSFVHEGRARFGKAKQVVTREKARELVVQAGEIIDFIEELLPEEARRPRLTNEVQVSTTLPLIQAEQQKAALTAVRGRGAGEPDAELRPGDERETANGEGPAPDVQPGDGA